MPIAIKIYVAASRHIISIMLSKKSLLLPLPGAYYGERVQSSHLGANRRASPPSEKTANHPPRSIPG
jgi:hypothetical protein